MGNNATFGSGPLLGMQMFQPPPVKKTPSGFGGGPSLLPHQLAPAPVFPTEQQLLARPQTWEYVSFPKGDQIVSTNDGVFIPRSFFGWDIQLGCEIEKSHQCVRVFVSAGTASTHETARTDADEAAARYSWISSHRAEFGGRWVVLEGDRLIASGISGKDVYQKARNAGIAVPFLVFVETDEPLPFAGW